MSTEKTVLVATVNHPERRFRIAKTKFDEVNAEAKEAGKKSPFIVQEEDCEGGKSYDQLTSAEQKKVDAEQVKRQERIDAEAEEDEE